VEQSVDGGWLIAGITDYVVKASWLKIDFEIFTSQNTTHFGGAPDTNVANTDIKKGREKNKLIGMNSE